MRWLLLLVVALLSVVMALATSLHVQLLWLTLLLCVATALHWHDELRHPHHSLPAIIRSSLSLAADRPLAESHHQVVGELLRIAGHEDPLFRVLAAENLDRLVSDVRVLGDGRVEFQSTESWRLAYERLLRSPGLYLYRSVAFVETQHYWQDGPGRQSTLLNLELQKSATVTIERIVILATHLWPDDQPNPDEPVLSWIDEQQRSGIRVSLIRESRLSEEPELLNDFGIYGNRALGMQRLDAAGRTTRFILSFDFDEVRRAESCWERLTIFSMDWADAGRHGHSTESS